MVTFPALLSFSSKLYFKNPDKGDLGTYSVSVSDTDGVSSSFVLDQEGKVHVTGARLAWCVMLGKTGTEAEKTCFERGCVLGGGWGVACLQKLKPLWEFCTPSTT